MQAEALVLTRENHPVSSTARCVRVGCPYGAAAWAIRCSVLRPLKYYDSSWEWALSK